VTSHTSGHAQRALLDRVEESVLARSPVKRRKRANEAVGTPSTLLIDGSERAIILGSMSAPPLARPVCCFGCQTDQEKSQAPSRSRIRCPLCGWSPRKEDKWFCTCGTCGNEWNTFDTGGVYPACLHQWTDIQCLSYSRSRRIPTGIGSDSQSRRCSWNPKIK
jgi:hypothetical protein